jgi:hypothetical protein
VVGPGCVTRRRSLSAPGRAAAGAQAAAARRRAGRRRPGLGGAGNEVTIVGSAGAGGDAAAGAGGAGTTAKISCGSVTVDPLRYTAGFARPAVRAEARRLAAIMSEDEKQQQMSGLPSPAPATSTCSSRRTTPRAYQMASDDRAA